MSDLSDWELVARARSGQIDAFEELVRRYQTPLIGFCRRMLGSLQDAEEVAQESFVRVYRFLDRLRPEAKFSTVLFGIARNLALNAIRDAGRRGRDVTHSLVRDDQSERAIEDHAHSPDRVARLREIEAMIEAALAELSPEHREVLVLREMHGLEYEAIAEIVKCRIGTVKSRLARGREQLRVRLEQLGGDEL
jgi:RNA polymerase sigma-70 factor (ECF subfamily)